ncbi:hypothetical protein NIES4071_29590 [Calothrix sp. NIES-4071]|nr:hypothetical protein NIES4071_29590 [Calothrix sp. NIES-4071]BAZ57279.1 hypothetical protein NIES4105_29530 [Calothrix sp. NIES-4105]
MDLIPEQQACNQNTTPEQLRALAAQSTQLARLVCTNPNAEPGLLRELANRSDYKILSAVANNPNTPTDVLWKVGVEFPEEVLSNPVFPLLLLENPNLVEEIPDNTLESFLKVDIVPDSLIKWVINSKKQDDLALAVTMNPKTSKDILEKLVNQDITFEYHHINYEHIIDSAKLHVNWSSEVKANWQEEAFTIMQNTVFGRSLRDFIAYQIGLIPESLMIKFSYYIFAYLPKNSKSCFRICYYSSSKYIRRNIAAICKTS